MNDDKQEDKQENKPKTGRIINPDLMQKIKLHVALNPDRYKYMKDFLEIAIKSQLEKDRLGGAKC